MGKKTRFTQRLIESRRSYYRFMSLRKMSGSLHLLLCVRLWALWFWLLPFLFAGKSSKSHLMNWFWAIFVLVALVGSILHVATCL